MEGNRGFVVVVINFAVKKKRTPTDGGNDAREILERGSILLPPRDESVLVAWRCWLSRCFVISGNGYSHPTTGQLVISRYTYFTPFTSSPFLPPPSRHFRLSFRIYRHTGVSTLPPAFNANSPFLPSFLPPSLPSFLSFLSFPPRNNVFTFPPRQINF